MSDYDAEGSNETTIFCSNLTKNVTEDILYELFLQAGPIQRVFIPKAKTNDGKSQRNYGFITYYHPVSVPYAIDIFAETSLFNAKLMLKPSNNDKNKKRPEQNLLAPTLEGNTRMLQYSNDSLRQIGSGGGNLRQAQHNSYMEPSMIMNPLASGMINQLDPANLLALGANFMFGQFNMEQLFNDNSDNRNAGNSDTYKMKSDRSYRNEPYNRHHNQHDRNRDHDRDRYDRDNRRDCRSNRNRR